MLSDNDYDAISKSLLTLSRILQGVLLFIIIRSADVTKILYCHQNLAGMTNFSSIGHWGIFQLARFDLYIQTRYIKT